MAKVKRLLGIIVIVALLIGAVPFMTQPTAADDGEVVTLSQIELAEKGNPKLDSQLDQLVRAERRGEAASFARQSDIELVDERVRVIVECVPGQLDAATEAATALGASVETSYDNLLQAVVPITSLTALADTPSIRLVRVPWYPLPAIVSEGVELINADEWQTLGYTGVGVKVGILDSGFTGYADLLGTELPSSVTTQSFYAGSDIEGDTDHGTACAEIVYDIAPDADFYLANFGTEVEMGNAVDWLIAQGVDVISCSIGWPISGPGDGTGTICDMVDDARTAGITWSQAIGNNAQYHWQGDFVDTDADRWHEFDPGVDITIDINVSSGSKVRVGLKWDDTWGSSGNDYDLYLADNTYTTVKASFDPQDGNDDPHEFLAYTATYTGVYHIAIYKYSATETVNFHIYSYRHDLQEYQVASSSLSVPADSSNAMSVGAVFWNTPTTLESFSSRGPTEDDRIKPDLVAPDGVSTATYGASNFYGTSASAPHAAGAAALVKGRYPSYTPSQIQTYLEDRAVDLGVAGKDNLFGSGRLLLPDATPPGDPTDVTSPSHTPSVWSTDNTIDITWTDATDAASGLDGYSILWDTTDNTVPDASIDIQENVETTTSPALADGNSRYFHIRSVDNVGNWQSTVHLGPFYIDATPPAATTDLTTSNPTRTSMCLTWTAPGDDANTGTASTYDIRYSTSPITAANWDSAAQCTGEPNPSPAGSTETLTVNGLSNNTKYYLTLKTADKVSNWSALSNVATGTTGNSPPVLSNGEVSPTSGYASTTFTYSVTYTDAENDAPSSPTVSIDGGTPATMMTKTGEDGDYTNGEIYEYTVTDADLGLGSHTFQFAASDGTDSATGDTGSHDGPTVSSQPAGGGGGGCRT